DCRGTASAPRKYPYPRQSHLNVTPPPRNREMFTWLSKLRRVRPVAKATARPARRRLSLESLEDRCMLSISAMANPIATVEGAPFSGLLGTFTSTRSGAQAGNFQVLISWGDASISAGSVTRESNGTFDVDGGHSYAEVGHYPVTLSITDTVSPDAAMAGNTATVADAPLIAQGTSFNATEQASFTGAVATFTDANPNASPGDFSITINWGDGDASTGSISGQSGSFTVIGTHTYP